MVRPLMPLLTAFLFACLSFAAEPLPPFELYVCEGNAFRALVPADWKPSGRTPPYADMTKVTGTERIGPANADKVPVTVALLYYSGEGHFTSPESYISARFGSLVRVDAEEGRKTTGVTIAGRKAKAFRMRTFELVTLPSRLPAAGKEGDPRVFELAPESRKAIIEERYVVVPAAKGFFVLQYRAPEEMAGAYLPVFEKVTGSFEPLMP